MTGLTAAVRQAVYEREGYACARCGGVDGPFAVHHRRARGMGGTRRPETNSLSALVLLCESCHLDVESHKTRAYENGWVVRQQADPAQVPFLYRGRAAMLTDLGAVEYIEAAS